MGLYTQFDANRVEKRLDLLCVCCGGQCRLTIAAVLGRIEIESGSGGRCPRTIAAALGRIEIESGSDSISCLIRNGALYPI